MNIIIQARYVEPMISYLRPNERIINYEPESPRNNIIHQLEYKPPSPSPPRTTQLESPTSSTSSLTPLQSVNSPVNTPVNSPTNIPSSPLTPTTLDPYIDISQSLPQSQPRPQLIIPPEIKIISTDENILHT